MANVYEIKRLLRTLMCYKYAIEQALGDSVTEVEALKLAETFMHIQALGGRPPDAGFFMKGPEIKAACEAAGIPLDFQPKPAPPPRPEQRPTEAQRPRTGPVTAFNLPRSQPTGAPVPAAQPATEPIDDSVAPFPDISNPPGDDE